MYETIGDAGASSGAAQPPVSAAPTFSATARILSRPATARAPDSPPRPPLLLESHASEIEPWAPGLDNSTGNSTGTRQEVDSY